MQTVHRTKKVGRDHPDRARLAEANSKRWWVYGVRTSDTIDLSEPEIVQFQVWLDKNDSEGRQEVDIHSAAVLMELFPQIEREQENLPDTLRITVLTRGTGVRQEVGHVTIDRCSFTLIPAASTVTLSAGHLRSIIDALKQDVVIGNIGEWEWREDGQ